MLKLGILSCAWQRPELFNLFLKGLKRLHCPGVKITPVIVVSEDKAMRLCQENGIRYINFANYPLGRKYNVGLGALKDMDYVMSINSDDFLCDKTLSVYKEYMDKKIDFIGIVDIYFYDKRTGRLGYFPGYEEMAKTDRRYKGRIGESLGACRVLSKSLLGKVNYRLWIDKVDRGLDWSMMQRLWGINYTKKIFSIKEKDLMIVDVKTNVNINTFDAYRTVKCDPQLLLDKIPEAKWI